MSDPACWCNRQFDWMSDPACWCNRQFDWVSYLTHWCDGLTSFNFPSLHDAGKVTNREGHCKGRSFPRFLHCNLLLLAYGQTCFSLDRGLHGAPHAGQYRRSMQVGGQPS